MLSYHVSRRKWAPRIAVLLFSWVIHGAEVHRTLPEKKLWTYEYRMECDMVQSTYDTMT
jgi:hypothetical protein